MYILNIILSIILAAAFIAFLVWAVRDFRAGEYKKMRKDLTMAGIALSVFMLNHWDYLPWNM